MRIFFLILLTLRSFCTSATVVQPDDGPYFQRRGENTLYIYEATTRDFIAQIQAYHEAYRAMYDQSFHWHLDEEQDLVLASPNQQVANAYATIAPNILSFWYPAGAGMLEEMAESSWALTLDSHETSHLYQLNSKGEIGAALHPFLGNSIVIVPFVWPIFPHPNIFLPTSFLEGNAVLNESRVNQGGRLHSGEKRATILAEVAAGDVSATRLINDEFIYPFGESAYVQGSYFQAHLAAKYGIERTNSFFKAHGDEILLPLIINNTFRRHFGASFYQEVHEYLHELQPIAALQQFSPGRPLLDTMYVSRLNQDGEHIWFTATNGFEPNDLFTYDKATHQLKRERIDLLLGQPFFIDGQVYTAATDQHDLHHAQYSLYGAHARLNRDFLNQIVTDRRAGKTVSLDARNSWLDPHILLNGESYDVGHSNPILDEAGNVYYFRQNGVERILFRNREPVFKYQGYYGKLTEIGADGSLYFIGNTDYGSTLYRFAGGEVRRILASDRVLDARQIGPGEFLVVEVLSRGTRVIVASAEEKAQTPVNYSYGFSTETVQPVAGVADKPVSERSYNSIRELRFSSLDLQSNLDSHGLSGSIGLNFNDPLQYQSVFAQYAGGNGDQQIQAQYMFTKYLLQPFLSYWWNQDHWFTFDGERRREYNQEVDAGFFLPVFKHERWSADWTFAGYHRDEDRHRDPSFVYIPPIGAHQELWGSLNRVELQWAIPSAVGFENWREFDLSYMNRLDSQAYSWRRKNNTSQVAAQAIFGLRQQFYLRGFGSYAWGETRDVDVKYNPYPLLNQIEVARLADHGDFVVKSAGALRVEFTKVFNVPAYLPRWPFGVNRIAPLFVAQGLQMDSLHPEDYPSSLFEYGYGADFEFLLLHRLPMRLRILEIFDTSDTKYRHDELLQMHLQKTF
jgi:hypothetical protein